METFGSLYSNRHHIRGADGPRGGIKSVCGRRMSAAYDNRLLRGATSEHVFTQAIGRRGWYMATPVANTQHWYNGYTFALCRTCCEEWVKNGLRADTA